MRTSRYILAATLLTVTLSARGQQWTLDTASITGPLVNGGTMAANGDLIMRLYNQGGTWLWRGNDQGEQLWSKRVAVVQDLGRQRLIEKDGVIHLPSNVRIELGPGFSGPQGDTVRCAWDLVQMDGNGDPLLAKTLHFSMLVDGNVFSVAYSTSRFVVDQDGSMLLASFLTLETWMHYLFLAKLDPQGELLWARVLDGWWYDSDTHNGLHIVPDGEGGLYGVVAADVGLGFYGVMHWDADGALQWSKKVTYTNAAVHVAKVLGTMLDPDGKFVVLCQTSFPGHNYMALFSMDQSAQLSDAHFYTPGPKWSGPSTFIPLGDGRLLLAQDSLLITVAADGTLEGAKVFVPNGSGDQLLRMNVAAWGLGPDGVVAMGDLNSVHVDFGYTTRTPMARKVEGEDGCLLQTVQGTHVAVPSELFTIEDRPIDERPLLEVYVEDLSGDLVEDGPDVSSSDLCAALGTGDPVRPQEKDIVNTLLRSGDLLLFATAAERRVTLLDATGRTVVQERLYRPGDAGIETAGRAPGVYLVQITDKDGGRMRTQRVMLAD